MWEFSQIHKPHWSGSSLPPICNPPWEQPIFFPFSGSDINVLSKAGPCGATAVSALKTHWILNKCTVSPVIICSVYHQSLAMIYVFVKSEEKKALFGASFSGFIYNKLLWGLLPLLSIDGKRCNEESWVLHLVEPSTTKKKFWIKKFH